MKHIKSINEFFGPFKDKYQDDYNDIGKEFVDRLSNIKKDQYEITSNEETASRDQYLEYIVKFDDVEIKSKRDYYPHIMDVVISNDYHFTVDNEDINCYNKYKRRIFKLIDRIYGSDKKEEVDRKEKEKIDKLRQNINTSAGRV